MLWGRFSVIVGVLLVFSLKTAAQDPLAEHRIRGLRGLKSVALVFQRGYFTVPSETPSTKDLEDIIRVALYRDVRQLTIKDEPETTPDWLFLVYTDPNAEGGHMRLSVYRWVKLDGNDLIAETWHEESFWAGTITPSRLSENLRRLLTSFAADYVKANQ